MKFVKRYVHIGRLSRANVELASSSDQHWTLTVQHWTPLAASKKVYDFYETGAVQARGGYVGAQLALETAGYQIDASQAPQIP